VRLLHELAKIHATFDDPHLVSHAGLVPVMALAQRAGLGGLAAEHVRIARPCGVNAPVKIACLAAGMAAGADSVDDMDLLRHGAMPVLFGDIRAPSTLGSFLRSFTWGNVLQLQKVHRQVLAELARRTPLLPGRDVLAFIDIDSQQKRVYGHAKQGAAFGHTKIQGKSLLVRGLNVLAATICMPLAAPVIAGTRLRGGNASSARGATSMTGQAAGTARAAGCTGMLVVRMDSAFYGSPAVWAARRAGARFWSPCGWTPWSAPRPPPSPKTPGRRSAIPGPSGTISWAAGSPTPRSRRRNTPPSPRSRGRPSPPGSSSAGSRTSTAMPPPARASCSPPGGTTRSSPTRRSRPIQAEEQHRGHAQAEQVFADWTDGPLAHLPPGSFPANAAWLALAAAEK
jgi:hypothetical protein